MVVLSTVQHGLVLTFNTPILPPRTLLPIALQGRDSLSQPYLYDLELVSAQAELDTRALLQSPCWIGVKQPVPIR